jgi:propionyl-CoA carboxylase alpha chain
LVKYSEPPRTLDVGVVGGVDAHVRVDAGVVPGYIVSPHYDPILSKIICYSPNSRDGAIAGLGSALDRYLLRGVRHNVPFVRDVLRNEQFVKGRTPTSFIDEHYPDGFSGGSLSEEEMCEMAAIAREVRGRRDAATGSVLGEADEDEVVVCLGGMFGDAYLVRSEASTSDGGIVARVTKMSEEGGRDGETRLVEMSDLEYEPSSDLAEVTVSGERRALQVHGEDETGTISITMYGSDSDVLVMSREEYELSQHMNEPKEPDLGDYVLSPMPGTLISFAVKEGDVVEMGQELCVVEAMKMQNVIRSHRAGAVVGKLRGQVGASLRADEVLLEFEKEGVEEEAA